MKKPFQARRPCARPTNFVSRWCIPQPMKTSAPSSVRPRCCAWRITPASFALSTVWCAKCTACGGAITSRTTSLIAPRLWFLGQTRNHRIFQNKSVSEIITLLLEGSPFTERSFAKLTADLPSARAQKRCSAIPAASSHGSLSRRVLRPRRMLSVFLPVVKAAWPIFTAGG